jgi:hypothetical protein
MYAKAAVRHPPSARLKRLMWFENTKEEDNAYGISIRECYCFGDLLNC